MKIYKDVFSGSELISDAFKHESPFGDASLDDIAFQVKAKRVAKGGEDYGISANTEEGEAEGGEVSEQVIDLVDGFRLQETNFDKKYFGAYMKAYMKRVKAYLEANQPDRVDRFIEGSQIFAKKLLERFDDLQFFMNEHSDLEAGIVYAYYEEGEVAPTCIYLRDGLKEEKC